MTRSATKQFFARSELLQNVVAREHRHLVRWAHVRPDEAVKLRQRIPGLPDAVLVNATFDLARLIQTSSIDREQPAMIAAANAFVFTFAVVQRCAAMGAARIQKSGLASAVTEYDQIFCEQSNHLR